MHSPEPWKLLKSQDDEKPYIVQSEGRLVFDGFRYDASAPTLEDARRIVACVNACRGVPTEVLEQIHKDEPVTLKGLLEFFSVITNADNKQ